MNIPNRMRPKQYNSKTFPACVRPKSRVKEVPSTVTKIHKPKYVRVGNNLIRDYISDIDQAERMIPMTGIRRIYSDKIKTTNNNENEKMLNTVHAFEKAVDKRKNERLHSKYSGIEKPQVNIAKVTKSLEKY